MEAQFTIQLTFQEGRKLGLVLIDGSDQVPASPLAERISGAVRSVATAISAAATTVAAAAQCIASPARTQRNNKRHRELKVCISPKSIVFTFASKLVEEAKALENDETDFNKLMESARTKPTTAYHNDIQYSYASFNEQSLLYALTGTMKPMDEIEKIQYRKTGTEKSCNRQNKTQHIGRRRSRPYFRSDHYKTFFCCNASSISDVTDILMRPENFPLYITLKRRPAKKYTFPIVTAESSAEPPRKRQRTNYDSQNQQEQQQQSNDGVICLLDSSDDEEEDTNAAETTMANSKDKKDDIDESFSMMSIEPHEFTVPKDPPLLSFEEDDDFVLTPYGSGKILTSRVERQASVTGNDATILKPIRIYSIDLHFGTCHIPASQIKPLTGTSYDKTIVTYQRVPLSERDLLRLRPLTYLNDTIINFYLKFVKSQVDADTAITTTASKSEGGLWDDFDGKGIHIFPTYCYTRIQSNLNGNRNSKKNRDAIWKDLKSWTKNVDIFKKRLLVFPINDSLHWTVCIVFHPGRLVRRYSKEVNEKKKNLELKQKQAIEEKKKKRWAVLDATSPLASQTGVAPLSLMPLLDGDECLVQPESIRNVVIVDDKPNTIPSVEQTVQAEETNVTNDTPAETKNDGVQWQCDFCSLKFETYDLAVEHESTCDENIDWCMVHFDSGKHFRLHKSTEVLANIRKYLNAAAAAEYESTHPGLTFTTKNMPGFSAAVLQQDNAKDCGVYMLEMAERMMRNTPQIDSEFVKRKGVSKNNFFGSNSFNKDDIAQKRDDIHQLIQRLRREAEREPTEKV